MNRNFFGPCLGARKGSEVQGDDGLRHSISKETQLVDHLGQKLAFLLVLISQANMNRWTSGTRSILRGVIFSGIDEN